MRRYFSMLLLRYKGIPFLCVGCYIALLLIGMPTATLAAPPTPQATSTLNGSQDNQTDQKNKSVKATPTITAKFTSVGGRVWIDHNQNGKWDAGEKPLVGATMHLYDSNGTQLFFSTFTNTEGLYSFNVLPFYRYIIRMDNLANYIGYTLSPGQAAQLPTPLLAPEQGNYPFLTITAPPIGPGNFNANFAFMPLRPELNLIKTNTGGPHGLIGQQVDYVLSVNNNLYAAPITSSYQIIVVDLLPKGLRELHVTNNAAWRTTLNATTTPAQLTATYIGPFPIAPGTVLPPIIISGILTEDALPRITSSAHMKFTNKQASSGSDAASNTIFVRSSQEMVPQVYRSSEPQRSINELSQDDTSQNNEPFYPELPKTGGK